MGKFSVRNACTVHLSLRLACALVRLRLALHLGGSEATDEEKLQAYSRADATGGWALSCARLTHASTHVHTHRRTLGAWVRCNRKKGREEYGKQVEIWRSEIPS